MRRGGGGEEGKGKAAVKVLLYVRPVLSAIIYRQKR